MSHQFDRRNTNTFLVNFFAEPHGAGIGAAHVGMVGPRGHVEFRLAQISAFVCSASALRGDDEYRRNQGNVRQVRAAGKGIIQNADVARADMKSRCSDRGAH